MDYSYKDILNKLLKEVPIKESNNVYGITFVAGQGFGKSTVAKMLSEKLGIIIIQNDQIRRFYDSLGFDSSLYEEDVKKMAFDRTVYLLKNKTSHIIDANMEFHYEMAIDNYSRHNAKLFIIELKCSDEEIRRRIEARASNFEKNSNQSRATLEDYNRYLSMKMEKSIPKELIFATINTDTTIDEIEKQVDTVVEKILKKVSNYA